MSLRSSGAELDEGGGGRINRPPGPLCYNRSTGPARVNKIKEYSMLMVTGGYAMSIILVSSLCFKAVFRLNQPSGTTPSECCCKKMS